jgi:Stress responsive A/B Barrel Domain
MPRSSSGRPFEASAAQSRACSPWSRGIPPAPKGPEDGYHYGFIVTFATVVARDAYLTDPIHRPVAEATGRNGKDCGTFYRATLD